MSEQEDFRRTEKLLEKMWEIHNKARISNISVRHPAKLFNILDQINHLNDK